MNGSARVYPRLYAFEVIVYAHIAVIWPFLAWRGFDLTSTFLSELGRSGFSLIAQALAGALVRVAVEAARGKGRAFLATILNRGWITDTLRMAMAGVMGVMVYGWIKLLVPLFHDRLFDAELWRLDAAICGGHSPNIFVLNLFSAPTVLKFFDAAYAKIFFASLAVGLAFFMSHPSRRVRVGFNTGNVFLWTIGAWLYLAIPSLGPAFAFPDVWLAYRRNLPVTNYFQYLLIHNYQNVLKMKEGAVLPVTFMFGVAAFPSLHVGFQTFVFFWMRRLWIYGQVLFGAFVLLIFLGSMITGWHYMVDGVAGAALAALAYWGGGRSYRVFRWLHLRRLLARAQAR